MIDLHAHLLPGVDDGPATWAEALELCLQLANQGVTGAVATPHFLPGRCPDAGLVLELVQELNRKLCSLSCALTVYPGAEACLVPDLPQLVAAKTVLTLNNTGRYLLLELPLEEIPFHTESVLFSLMLNGIAPVLAHPERNAQMREDPALLVTLVERGVLVQVNAGSLAGEFGLRVQKFAGKLVQHGLVHFMGSDSHCPRKRPSLWPAALTRLKKLAGQEATLAITQNNPATLLAGAVLPVPPASRRSNFWERALVRLRSR